MLFGLQLFEADTYESWDVTPYTPAVSFLEGGLHLVVATYQSGTWEQFDAAARSYVDNTRGMYWLKVRAHARMRSFVATTPGMIRRLKIFSRAEMYDSSRTGTRSAGVYMKLCCIFLAIRSIVRKREKFLRFIVRVCFAIVSVVV